MTNTSIYVLEGITPKYNYDETDFVKDDFGNIICSVDRIGVYDDVKKAETDLTELIQLNERLNWKYDSKSKYFCFTLDELYLNNAIYGAGNISTFESRRSYLNDGRLNCFSDYDDRCCKKFYGRSEPLKYVKNGDYCFMLSGNKLVPILLEECSPTVETLKARFKHQYVGDFTDDSGLAFSVGNGHIHPMSPTIFPNWNLPEYTFTDELKTKLMAEREKYFNGNEI